MRTKQQHQYVGFSGISRVADQYHAELFVETKQLDLGVFDSHEAAAQAYDQASRELHSIYRRIAQRSAATGQPRHKRNLVAV